MESVGRAGFIGGGNTIVDLSALADALELGSLEALRTAHRAWINEALATGEMPREEHWTQSLAVGSVEFAQGDGWPSECKVVAVNLSASMVPA